MVATTLQAPLVAAGIIDVEHDDLRPVWEIAKERTGKRPPPAGIWRWRKKGCRGAKLECVQVCGVWCTTTAAFAEFIRQQTANANAACRAVDSAPIPGPRDSRTDRRLRSAGLLRPASFDRTTEPPDGMESGP